MAIVLVMTAILESTAGGGNVRWIAMITVIVVMVFVCARRATLEWTAASLLMRRCHTSASSIALLIVLKPVLLFSKRHRVVMVPLGRTIAIISARNRAWTSASKGVFLGLLERAPCSGFDVSRLSECVMDDLASTSHCMLDALCGGLMGQLIEQ